MTTDEHRAQPAAPRPVAGAPTQAAPTPGDAEALRAQAREAARQGHHDEALGLLSRAAQTMPDHPGIALDVGRLLGQRGALVEAVGWFERALALQPGSIEARFFLGFTQLRMGLAAEALPHLRAVAGRMPTDASVVSAWADAAFHCGAHAEALEATAAALRVKPQDEDLRLKHGECLARLGRFEASIAFFKDSVARLSDSAGLWMALAQAQEEAGDADEAEAAYRRALGLKPGWVHPLAGLLGLRRGGVDEDTLAVAASRLASQTLDDAEQALLAYPMGRALDARGEAERAFALWREANAAREREVGAFDEGAFLDEVAQRLGEPVSPAPGREGKGGEWVFVVGMPRSGTTLVEQILDAHPEVAGCGELPFFAELALRFPQASAIDGPQADALAAQYLETTSRFSGTGSTRFVDKAPLNALHLGHVARLFPAAKVLWCRRDARDVGLSIYSENFAKSARFAASLRGIGVTCTAQHRLMRHWQQASGMAIHEVVYEAVVDDLESQVRGLLAFCGLPWSASCLEFHSTGRVVQTPSRWQVRRPVHRGSIGRWQRYASHLGPLLDALSLPLEADGIPRT